jgi:hypothetical protein
MEREQTRGEPHVDRRIAAHFRTTRHVQVRPPNDLARSVVVSRRGGAVMPIRRERRANTRKKGDGTILIPSVGRRLRRQRVERAEAAVLFGLARQALCGCRRDRNER